MAAQSASPTARQQLADAQVACFAREVIQAEADVAGDREMGKQRVVLEHHPDAALLRGQLEAGPAHHLAIEQDFACAHRLEAGDTAQQRGLAAAAGPQQAGDVPGGRA